MSLEKYKQIIGEMDELTLKKELDSLNRIRGYASDIKGKILIVLSHLNK